jgi:hypothetical protein
MPSCRIETAQRATRTVHELLTAAHGQLQDGRPVNSLGIPHKPESQAFDIQAATGLFQRAADLIEATKWPTDHDYNSV